MRKFILINSRLEIAHRSTVPNNKKISIWYPSLITRNSSRAWQPLSRVNVTELLRRLLVKMGHIYLFKIIIIIKNMETCFLTKFANVRRLMLIQHVLNPLLLICQQLLSQNAAGHRRRKRQSEGWSALRTFCDSVCKLLSTVISDYSCQDPETRGQDPLKAGEMQT